MFKSTLFLLGFSMLLSVQSAHAGAAKADPSSQHHHSTLTKMLDNLTPESGQQELGLSVNQGSLNYSYNSFTIKDTSYSEALTYNYGINENSSLNLILNYQSADSGSSSLGAVNKIQPGFDFFTLAYLSNWNLAQDTLFLKAAYSALMAKGELNNSTATNNAVSSSQPLVDLEIGYVMPIRITILELFCSIQWPKT